jgi:hypothetical protein
MKPGVQTHAGSKWLEPTAHDLCPISPKLEIERDKTQ